MPRSLPAAARILDHGSALARGLTLYIPDHEPNSNAKDLGRKRAVTTAAGTEWRTNAFGTMRSLTPSAGSQFVSCSISPPGATSPCSIACWFEPNDMAAGTYGFLSWATTATSGTPYFIFQRNNNNLRIYWAGAYRVDLSGVLAEKTLTHVGLSFDGSVCHFYVNGRSAGSFTGSATNTSATTFYIGTGYSVTRNCRVGDTGVWARALSATEMRELYSTPFRLLRRRRTYFIPAAAPPGGFIAAWARNRSAVIGAGMH